MPALAGEAGRDGAMKHDRKQECPWCGHWMEVVFAYRDMQGHEMLIYRCMHCFNDLKKPAPWPEEVDDEDETGGT